MRYDLSETLFFRLKVSDYKMSCEHKLSLLLLLSLLSTNIDGSLKDKGCR